MLLTRLKYWRELRGYSVRGLAEKSKVGFTTISFLENQHRPPHGTTASKLAAALGVEVADLYGLKPEPINHAITNDNTKPITALKPARSNMAGAKKQPVISFWVIEKDQEEGDPFRTDTQAEADRLKARLGQAKVYQAASKFEAWELHRQFLIRVARGYDAW
jgi:transcriptional regulator with XRE-family HTH domain